MKRIWLAGLLSLATLGHGATQTDVLVYGATPAGIAAALAAGKAGSKVLLVEPTSHLGGLVTSGLSHTDYHSFESLSGAFLQFARRVEDHYARTYGRNSDQVKDSHRGTFGEPKANLLVFKEMLAEQKRVELQLQWVLAGVELAAAADLQRIRAVVFTNATGQRRTFEAGVFIDATYEGDLMAMAGVPWRVGREGRNEYGESLAPEKGDGQLQAYNFRFCMTTIATNRVAPGAPPGYQREDFLGVLPVLASGQIKRIFGYPSQCIFKAQTPALPNGKYDINDVSRAPIRLSLPGRNLDWPNGEAAARTRVFADHLRDNVGLLYFLQNDPEVPARFREEALEWGWCRDEFRATDHLPPQLYVREARRMQGVHIFTQKDSEWAVGDARALLHMDSIAMGDYGNNCHGTARTGTRFQGEHSGEFYYPVPPYQVPYGVLLPRQVSNLLVPGAVSSSHVGFCALRLEPIWMSLGQAAGHAGAIASRGRIPVQKVNIRELQKRLHQDGSATIYTSDVLSGHPAFAAVQWWGTAGGFHGMFPRPDNPRGKNLHGQYFEAAPGHAVELERVLDEKLSARWLELASALGLNTSRLPRADGRITRGDFIHAAARQAR